MNKLVEVVGLIRRNYKEEESMSNKKLIKATEVYMFPAENLAYAFVEEVKEEATEGLFELKKCTIEDKTTKKDAEEGFEKWHCTLVKNYNFD